MHALRRRFAMEEGVSIVEMLVAIFVISVAVFSMLNVFVTSAHSGLEQRLRTAATRAGADHLEDLRALGYGTLKSMLDDGYFDEDPEPRVDTDEVDGRVFDITTWAEESPADPDADDDYDGPTVIVLTAEVSWQTRRGTRTTTYSTSVGPRSDPNAGLAEALASARIVSVSTTPASAAIRNNPDQSGYGNPLAPTTVTVVTQGVGPEAAASLRWTNKDGTVKNPTLTTGDNGLTWSVTIPAADIWWPLSETEIENGQDLDIDVTVGPFQRPHSIALVPAAADPPVIESTGVTPSTTILVEQPSGGTSCNSPSRCRNVNDLVFSLTVSGNVDPNIDSARLKYQLIDGTFQEQGLAYHAGSGTWRLTIDQQTVKFKRGSAQQFTFTYHREERENDEGAIVAESSTVHETRQWVVTWG